MSTAPPQAGLAHQATTKAAPSAEIQSNGMKENDIAFAAHSTRKLLRKKKPVPKDYTKMAWVAGHMMTLVFGFCFVAIYFINFRHRRNIWSKISYRLGLFGSILAYSVTAITKFGKGSPDFFALITTENFQYLLLCVVWVFTRSSVFKLLPYLIISFLQLSKYYGVLECYPKGLVKRLAMLISYNELMLVVVLFMNTLLLRGTSGYALVTFGLFYWLRIVYSESTKLFFRDVTHVIDERIIKKCPEPVRIQYQKIIKSAELRSDEVEKIFRNIRQSNKRIEKLEKAAEDNANLRSEKEDNKVPEQAFATAPAVSEPQDVDIHAREKEPDEE